MTSLKLLKWMLPVSMVAVLSGCDWEGTDDNETWNSSRYGWVNFSGVYQNPDGGYLVATFAPPASSPASTAPATQSIGVGDGSLYTFSGILANVPIVPLSVTVGDGVSSAVDNGAGTLIVGGTTVGTVNYLTGAISVDFSALLLAPPAAGSPIVVAYTYSVAGTPANPEPGGSGKYEIYTFAMEQTGNLLTMYDNYGTKYTGQLSTLGLGGGDLPGQTPSGENLQSGLVIGNFELTGANGVRIVGTMQGDLIVEEGTASGETGRTYSRTVSNRTIQGTWIEPSGATGNIIGQAAGEITTTTTEPGL